MRARTLTAAAPRPRQSRRLWPAIAMVSTGLIGAPAFAQKWFVEAGIDSRVDASTNVDLGAAAGSKDLVVNVRPQIRLQGETLRLKVSGTIGVIANSFGRSSQPARVLPSGDISARLEAVERLVFLDAGYRASQTGADPFGVRTDATTNSNTFTTSQFRFSPSIERDLAPDLHLLVRSDNSWTSAVGSTEQVGVSNASGYFARHSASLQQDPRPLGWRVEAERSRTRYRDPSMESLNIDVARASVNYLLAEDVTVGVRAGRERNRLPGLDEDRNIYGLEAAWRPSPRTTLSAFGERRFFGQAWDVAFAHRQPQFAWEIGMSKTINSTPQSLFELPATQNVAGLVDSMLTTRFPDPIERARAVQELMLNRGLPGSTLSPLTLFSERLSLVTSQRATVTVVGVRNTVTVGGFMARTEDLPGVTLADTGSLQANTRQFGANVVLTHKVTPLANLKAGFDWSRIRGLGAGSAQATTEHTLSLQLDVRAGVKTNAYIGGLHRTLSSTVVTPGHESRLYLGLDHRF